MTKLEKKFIEVSQRIDIEAVKGCIEAGVNINIQEKEGWTALMFASRNGCTEIAKSLIEAGADINIQSKSGWTVLMLASCNGHLEIVKLLIRTGCLFDQKLNHSSETNVNINAQEMSGWTALMSASFYGHTEIVRFLIDEANANLNIKNNNGSTSLGIAKEKLQKTKSVKFQDIINLLENAMKIQKLEKSISMLDNYEFSI